VWLKLLLAPLIVNVDVPVLACLLTEMVSVELPLVLTGLTLKVALVLLGSPLTLRLTELEPFSAVSEIVDLPLCPRLIVRDVGDAEILKSGVAAATVIVKPVE